jgi:ankyrin repeat protein
MENLDEQMLSAALSGDLATVESLVSKGADINFMNPWGTTAVFSAAWEGNIEALDLFYSLGANITFEQTNLLCNAAFNGKVTSVKWLLEKGEKADFSFANTGENALHYTICKTSEMEERTEIVRLLIAAGADVNKKTIAGSEDGLCFMRDVRLRGETPLHRAAAYASPQIVKMLIDAGADISIKDANGDSPITWGSWHLRDSDLLRLLVYDGVAGIH